MQEIRFKPSGSSPRGPLKVPHTRVYTRLTQNFIDHTLLAVEEEHHSDENAESESASEHSDEEEESPPSKSFFKLQLPFRAKAEPTLPRARWSAGILFVLLCNREKTTV